MSSYVIPLFPAAAASPLPTRDAVAAELSRLRDRVDAGLPGKADKVPSAATGNLASLDASGNLSDSGATPASIKAAAVAEVVANAPGTMDTLKEIADILGSSQQSGTVLKRISDLESGKADSSSLAAVATSGSYGDLSDRPVIPPAVTFDATLTTQGAAADAKAVGDALRGGFTEWVCDEVTEGYEFVSCEWEKDSVGPDYNWCVRFLNTMLPNPLPAAVVVPGVAKDAISLSETGTTPSFSLSRHLITPTKTSQLTNDGDGTNAFVKTNDSRLSDARTPTAHTHAMADVTGLNAALAQKANASDLPYRLVEPGKWEFRGLPSGMTVSSIYFDDGVDDWNMILSNDAVATVSGDGSELSLTFSDFSEGDYTIIATRASLPGHLCDRAGNRVVVSGDTTLTLPADNHGHMRDLYVRLTVSATSAVTWTIAQGETWDAIGTPPSSFAEGTHLYRITEVAPGVWHAEDMFAVAGKMPMYPMVAVAPTSGTLTVAPYTVSTYTASTSAAAFTVEVGTGAAGMARDCELVIDCTATGAVAPTVTWPSNFHPRTDAGTDFACEAGTRNVYYISEYATGEFAVGGWQETTGDNA